jgi:hypothetical protein
MSNVSLSGVHWIVDCHHWAAKQLWILVVLAALALSGYYSWAVSYSYLNTSSFSVDYSIDAVNVSQAGLVPFPEVVFCLAAPWHVEKSKQINMSINLLSYMTNFLYPYGGFGMDESFKDSSLRQELDIEYENLLKRTGFNAIQLLDQLTVSCEDILVFCFIGNRRHMGGKECCRLLFTQSGYSTMGKCFRSSSRLLNISLREPGFQSGLELKLTVPTKLVDILNPSILNLPASLSDGVYFAATDKKSHLITVGSKMKGKEY